MWKWLRAIFPSGSQKCFLNGRRLTLDSDISNVENQPIEYAYTFYYGKFSLILVLATATKHVSVMYLADGSIKVWIEDKGVPLSDSLKLRCKYIVKDPLKVYDLLLYCLDYVKYERYNLLFHNCRDFVSEFVRHFKCKDILMEDIPVYNACKNSKVKISRLSSKRCGYKY